MWRDLERLCERHRLPWKRPSAFPRNSVLAARVACAGEGRRWLGAFVSGAFVANFGEDRDIADADVLAGVLAPLGAEAASALERARSPEVKAQLRARTDEAARLGLFGAPTFVAQGELFFGQDRLDEALEWARR
jgi:2-hydroxychromene-2-carboxylate isomerase